MELRSQQLSFVPQEGNIDLHFFDDIDIHSVDYLQQILFVNELNICT